MNAQLETIANRIACGMNAAQRRELITAAYRVGLETAILKIQENAEQSACDACTRFLTNLANELRDTKP